MITSLRRQFVVFLFVLSIFYSPLLIHSVHATGERFTDNGNGTVADNQTNLIWLKDANCFGRQTWANAINSANNLASGVCGLSDDSVAGQWRLPNRREMQSLLDRSHFYPVSTFPGVPFNNVLMGAYWTSSTVASDPNRAWFVNYEGALYNYNKLESQYVWPVRSSQSVSIRVMPSGTLRSGQNVDIVTDKGGIDCLWDGVALSGVCFSSNISFGAMLTLTASLPVDTQISWGVGCDSATATTCTINSLVANIIIFPVLTSVVPQTIIFNPPTDKTYGDAPFELIASGGASGNQVTFAVTSGPGILNDNVLTIIGAGTIVITASQAGNADYSAAPDVQRIITVAKANATITFADLSQAYDGTAKNATVITSPANIGLIVSYKDAAGNSAVSPVNPGTYNILATISDSNYQGSATGTLTITKMPPIITGAALTQPNSYGWYNGNVTVHFTATDPYSLLTVTPDTILMTEGAGQSVTGTAVDKFGISASSTVSGINIDKTAPVVAITGVVNGATYNLGLVPQASYTANDALSGIATSSDSLTGGDIQGFGQFTYTITATDKAGNITVRTVEYTVNATSAGTVDLIRTLPLEPQTATILIETLTTALNFYADGKSTAGDNKMGAFINKVNAPGRNIPPDVAAILINAANYIISHN